MLTQRALLGTEKEYTMDFTPPFKRVSMMSGLEEVN
jgi:hypothetical protein